MFLLLLLEYIIILCILHLNVFRETVKLGIVLGIVTSQKRKNFISTILKFLDKKDVFIISKEYIY